MPTKKRVEADRRNPPPHGINAKEQIMFGETEEDLVHLTAEYHDQYQPANPTERFLVDTLINNEWRLRRLRCAEAELWQSESDLVIQRNYRKEVEEPFDVTAGETFAQGLKSFLIVQRIINSCERNLHRALKELQRLQSKHPAQPEQGKPTSAPTASLHQFPQPGGAGASPADFSPGHHDPHHQNPSPLYPSVETPKEETPFL
jgi:hypothetical protein